MSIFKNPQAKELKSVTVRRIDGLLQDLLQCRETRFDVEVGIVEGEKEGWVLDEIVASRKPGEKSPPRNSENVRCSRVVRLSPYAPPTI
jgi:hypothetical protein